MLRDAFFLAMMDMRRLLRSRSTVLWTFIMPVVFFYFIGTITGRGFGGNTKDPLAVSVPADAGFLADQLVGRLDGLGYQVVRTQTQAEFLSYGRRLEIPAGFTASLLAAKPVKLRFTRTGDDMSANYDRARLSRAAYTMLADLAVLGGKAATPEDFVELAKEPRALGMDVKPAGKRLKVPTGYDQAVPGTMVMFTLLVMFTTGAVTLTIERNQGMLRRLASSPMSRGAVVLGKWGARAGLGMIQITFAMVAGSVLFHIHWGPNLPVAAVVLIGYGALAAALAMLLGNFGRSEGQVVGLGVIAGNLMAGLGGCWWPMEIAPAWVQKLSLFLPTGLTMDALHKLVNFGAAPSYAIPHICVMLAAALAAGYLLSRSFRFQ
jgi:ABC-2 type transport system permease protein